MVDKTKTPSERKEFEKLFKSDIKKHIDAISSKYIIEELLQIAIMFLPAEAIFAEINAYHGDLIEYSYKKEYGITNY